MPYSQSCWTNKLNTLHVFTQNLKAKTCCNICYFLLSLSFYFVPNQTKYCTRKNSLTNSLVITMITILILHSNPIFYWFFRVWGETLCTCQPTQFSVVAIYNCVILFYISSLRLYERLGCGICIIHWLGYRFYESESFVLISWVSLQWSFFPSLLPSLWLKLSRRSGTHCFSFCIFSWFDCISWNQILSML